jgi:hypothetical protein
MYNNVKELKDKFSKAQSVDISMQRPILVMKDDNAVLFDTVTDVSRHSLMVETEILVMRLFTQNNVAYIPFEDDSKYRYMPFIRIENGKRIAYIFTSCITKRIDWQYIKEQKKVDGIKVVAFVEVQQDTKTLNTIVNEEIRRSGGFVQYETLKDLFNLLGPDEYSKYKKYVGRFNDQVRKLIGYSTVTIPSEETVQQFKTEKIELLQSYDYRELTKDLYADQVEILNHNYFERGLCRAIIGDANFAESFISAEWYFNTHMATSGLEQTAIVVGYLKSVEQLLYGIIRLSIDTGKTIKKKGSNERIEYTSENEDFIDNTLGALIGYAKHYSELWGVNNSVKYFITVKLTEYRERYRNEHFHKNNVYDIAEIEDIRKQTIFMYYLLLGGCIINDEDFATLKIQPEKDGNSEECVGLTYATLEGWLDRILGGDPLLDKTVPLYFWLDGYGYGPESWQLHFTTVSGFRDSGWADDMKFPLDMKYRYDPLLWPAKLERDEAEAEVISMIKQYLQDGKYAGKLKTHKTVDVGLFAHPQRVYDKE